jgi:hypothetical protein
VLDLVQSIEPLLRKGAGHLLDTRRPLNQVVTQVLRLVGEHA